MRLLGTATWMSLVAAAGACSSSSTSNDASVDAGTDAPGTGVDAGGDGTVVADSGQPSTDATTVGDTGTDGPKGPTQTPNPPSSQTPTAYQLLGRFEPNGDGGFRADWSGSGVHAKFTGPSISIDMSSATSVQYTIVIDGVPIATPLTLATAARGTHVLATGLAAGTHDVIFFKRNEADKGTFVFYGLIADATGALVNSAPPFQHRLEFIGDSITAGYGNLGPPCPDPDGVSEDGYQSFASITARKLSSDVHIVAFSGRGAYRDYTGDASANNQMETWFKAGTTVYDGLGDLQPDIPWDFTTWTADALVVALGTNDYNSGDPGQPFVTAFVSLLQFARTKYPGVPIFLGLGPKLSGPSLAACEAALENIVTAMQTSATDTSIQIVSFATLVDGADECQNHPLVTDDQTMATTLADQIAKSLGWAEDSKAQ
jgi:hypothetical protein